MPGYSLLFTPFEYFLFWFRFHQSGPTKVMTFFDQRQYRKFDNYPESLDQIQLQIMKLIIKMIVRAISTMEKVLPNQMHTNIFELKIAIKRYSKLIRY